MLTSKVMTERPSDRFPASAGKAPPPEEVTALLRAAEAGDREAVDRLFSILYGQLRAIAHRQLRQAPAEQTLSTTALVNEAYLKLSQGAGWSARDRSHFYSLAARAMRLILIDRARSRMRGRRGGGLRPLDLDVVDIPIEERAAELVALDEALDRLGAVDEELAKLVEWRFFAGLSVEEIADISGRSVRTLKRHWQTARAFLFQELTAPGQAS